MSIWRNIRFGLRAFGQSSKASSFGASARKVITILRTEGPVGITKRFRALTPLPRARGGDPSACLILTTPHVEWIARRMARILQSHGLRAEVAGDANGAEKFGHVFVLTPQRFATLPLDFIAFQMEQHVSDRWMTPEYLAVLGRARAVLDYSQRNIRALTDAGLSPSRMFFTPLSPDPDLHPGPTTRETLLFVGDISAPRRKRVLDAVRVHFPDLRVEVALFGDDLRDALNHAKVVLNLHYYDHALLETARIYQARSHGAWVVSETASDQTLHGDLPGVIFAPEGDTDELIAAIRTAMEGGPPPDENGEDSFAQWFRRALLGLGLITPQDFDAAHPDWPSPIKTPAKLCLSLIETPIRREGFLQQPPAQEFQIWEGLRGSPGWRGAAISYRQIFDRLLRSGVTEATVCEDDVIFTPEFPARMSKVAAQLARSDWDMFSGFIADLPQNAQVLDVTEQDGEIYVTLDRAVSMVFNIYRRPVMEWLAEWDADIDNAFTNTIDRRLERHPFRIVTTLPFLVGHREDARSTLREFGNDKYLSQLSDSEDRLRAMVKSFLAN